MHASVTLFESKITNSVQGWRTINTCGDYFLIYYQLISLEETQSVFPNQYLFSIVNFYAIWFSVEIFGDVFGSTLNQTTTDLWQHLNAGLGKLG